MNWRDSMKVRGPILWTLVLVFCSALLYWSIEHNLARAVTVQQCHDGVCVDVCDGAISTPAGMHLTYQVHCSPLIFKDGFEEE